MEYLSSLCLKVSPPQTASTAVPLTSQHPLEKAHVVVSSFPLFTNNIQDRGAYKQKLSNCFFTYIFLLKKYFRQPYIDFDFCNLSSSGGIVYKER